LEEPYKQFRLNKQLVGESKKLKISEMDMELFNLIGSREHFQRPDKILYISIFIPKQKYCGSGIFSPGQKKKNLYPGLWIQIHNKELNEFSTQKIITRLSEL
jgi:hypothetical protein